MNQDCDAPSHSESASAVEPQVDTHSELINKENYMKLSNNNNGTSVSVLHGENFMRRIDTLPEGETVKTKLYVVGHSESGHNHVLKSDSDIEVLETDNQRFVLVNEVAELFHQKSFDIHETITIAPGVYEITHKTEYDPFNEVIRQVWD